MIQRVSHTPPAGCGPAVVALALSVASELHTPAPASRAPELAAAPVPQLMGLHVSAARPHRRKVPLNRLSAVRA
ncbi:hypothetical protein LK07_18660 [Streptomyces pluripotens]|uniref:Uncharacterized protein n=1 Tax=Streptomyces pluripotens TaxID=1355015 RepID=A0A221P0D0_9ACTN|nr:MULTISPECIES: hypothetical protein [Streptomyces]ARP71447.1 hypothetical protein LK06_017505 [Streptomyces pluripotens]ASN25697.1 hypothetical protein LK07_18660 [Streptomyces pluripotens]KIE25021.1 hypothetical protein LK08_20990 [Streptomyces sp. MUSC 125]MCH0560153.1 hypothetical protein [Streptomyces sp. MUM 16J]